MDSTDYDIIKYLQDDGRMPMKILAEKVSLTPPAVAERVRKLEKNGLIIGYRAIVDPKKLGKTVKAIINISIKTSKRKEFLQLVQDNKNIVECHHVTGKYSMTIKALCNDTSDLEFLIGKIQNYGSTETLIILSSPIEFKSLNYEREAT
ncbi:Lrp/AsnC family transcriptional regulator [Vallitalea pronyensis]|uniref:Lrp/AsnC family transcriptional regulator n=1 Tax=Vallitalea pronyensis TaxID=1348613 RepID=A0A8J8MNM1_9FIRM|nr:Lrp/AsnC family transcriptional regulator [Vallitalea pronyensis]QUI25130.1 Lrp/AsnC family transcriptional regulator [Vallitalea pronyensis]